MDSLRYESSYAQECEFLTNITNQYDKNPILCAKVSENMICYLILILHFEKKADPSHEYPAKFYQESNLGSNMIRVTKLFFNIGMKLLSQVYRWWSIQCL